MRSLERALAGTTLPGDVVMMSATAHAHRCLGHRHRARAGRQAHENLQGTNPRCHSDTEIRWIPLRDLQPSDRNARTTAAPAEAMRELEASLEAHGLLENLVVRAHDDGKTFQVVGGGRRLRALRTLAKKRQSRFRTTTPIPCRVIADDAIDEEISAAENLVRVNMHPVDQFTAFHKLLERGLSAREIANRFGLTARTVQRRLRLGGVAPEILSEARENRLTLELLEAFAATPDRARQLDVWNKMQSHNGYAPTASWIRNELQRNLVSAASARARFVGLKAYKAAGGTVGGGPVRRRRRPERADPRRQAPQRARVQEAAERAARARRRLALDRHDPRGPVGRDPAVRARQGQARAPDRRRQRAARGADGRDRPAQAGGLRRSATTPATRPSATGSLPKSRSWRPKPRPSTRRCTPASRTAPS